MSGDGKPPFTVIDGDGGANDVAPKPDGANDEALELKIRQLEEEHRDLDQAILTMEERMPYDRLTIGRMKKRKLILKDQIQELRDQLFPDIIA
ncbi:DUF465 domain-containing protein [Parvularcula sp. ZS-1/3]|uniref:DUF465 domain-containing protein n=1 Tax=Parvularcula mediterranea TaxID=2732508 RepID=A0A7Y3RPK8_9PROT|nr:DUF465 domain-containing protein [Parvularcula mediterranea]NNU17475.1 DUF465 domain-containing protein [Parvularcula mediterranea]